MDIMNELLEEAKQINCKISKSEPIPQVMTVDEIEKIACDLEKQISIEDTFKDVLKKAVSSTNEHIEKIASFLNSEEVKNMSREAILEYLEKDGVVAGYLGVTKKVLGTVKKPFTAIKHKLIGTDLAREVASKENEIRKLQPEIKKEMTSRIAGQYARNGRKIDPRIEAIIERKSLERAGRVHKEREMMNRPAINKPNKMNVPKKGGLWNTVKKPLIYMGIGGAGALTANKMMNTPQTQTSYQPVNSGF